MQPREFVRLIGGASVWPIVARAQPSGPPVLGFLSSRTEEQAQFLVRALRAGLKEAGYIEGRNLELIFVMPTTELNCLRDLRPN